VRPESGEREDAARPDDAGARAGREARAAGADAGAHRSGAGCAAGRAGEPAPGSTPRPSGKPDAARGAQLYAANCASCHGATGAGDGPAAAALQPKPAHHDDGNYMNALSNDHLFQVIQQGGASVGKSPLMAPWGGVLSNDQIWDVIAYVRSLAKPAYTGSVP